MKLKMCGKWNPLLAQTNFILAGAQLDSLSAQCYTSLDLIRG